jgi:phosphoribosylformimino-5-aminoimidazole carboxamide ribotide isomerase
MNSNSALFKHGILYLLRDISSRPGIHFLAKTGPPPMGCFRFPLFTFRLTLGPMFRPCIDLHEGRVKQIVGGTLGDSGLRTNFVSEKPAAWFADLYRRDNLTGGHVIMLGPGNEKEARAALAAFPGGLQIGGGINADNASAWLDAGASHVIVTSWVFREGRVDWDRLEQLVKTIGKERLVIDLSCRKKVQGSTFKGQSPEYFVVTDRWQKFTDVIVNEETLKKFSAFCSEFLVHAVDVEGLCRGIDRELVEKLGRWTPIPTTYAGGANSLADLEEVARLGNGKVHLTIGSALDIFGGKGVRYEDCVKFNRSGVSAERRQKK